MWKTAYFIIRVNKDLDHKNSGFYIYWGDFSRLLTVDGYIERGKAPDHWIGMIFPL